MYVEDEEDDALLMQMAFRRAGVGSALQVVGDGREAIKYLEGRNGYENRERHPMPRVLLLDLNLPDMSGFDVLEWLKANPELTTLPVVIFSSSSREEDKRRARELGAVEYIEKPISAAAFGSIAQRLSEQWLGG